MHQTRSQAIGREGERWFQNALPSTWIFQRPSEDIGIDGVVVITDDDDMRGVEFRVQIKSSERWPLDGDHIVVRGLSRQAVRYWASGLTPTLLVLYDQKRKLGWGGFVLDLVGDPTNLLTGTTKTFILRCPTSLVINTDGWQRVKRSIYSFYDGFSSAFRTAHAASVRLPVIHTLCECLNGLHMVQFAPPATSFYDSIGPTLLQTLGHRDVVRALRRLKSAFATDSFVATRIDSAIATYCAEVQTFFPSFDELLAHESDAETKAYWHNAEEMARKRPTLISLITEFLLFLSRDYNSTTQSNPTVA